MAAGPVLIVVPTYNERDNVEEVAERFTEALPDAELLFVDDNSPDGTGEVLDRLAADDGRLHVLHRPGKLGLGTAYLDGFRWGLARGYDYLFEMDADFSHDPRYLPEMLARGQGRRRRRGRLALRRRRRHRELGRGPQDHLARRQPVRADDPRRHGSAT